MPKHLKKYNMKTTIITLLLTVTCCLSLNSANKTLNVYKLAAAPVVDGNLSEWGCNGINVEQIKVGTTSTASTITVTGAATYIYSGSPKGPTTSTVTGSTGVVTYTYSGTGLTTYAATTTRPTNVGTYQVIASVAADANNSAATSSPFAFSILAVGSPSSITVTGATTYFYTGSALGPNTSTVSGSTGAVTYSYMGTGSTTYAPSSNRPTNVGTYQVIASVAADANFSTATSSPFAFNILAVGSPSTISVTGGNTYIYTGTALGPSTATITGSTGAVTYSYMGTGSTTYGPSTTRPTIIGTYQVIASVAADANYSSATSSPFAFAIVSSSSYFSTNKVLNVYKVTKSKAPKIDGSFSDWGSTWTDVTQIKAGNTTTACHAKFQTRYTNDSLYVIVNVVDPTPHNEDAISNVYEKDCVELFVSMDTVTVTGLGGDFQYRLQRDNSQLDEGTVSANAKSYPVGGTAGYLQEWALSWDDICTRRSVPTDIPLDGAGGRGYIKFDIHVSDNTTGAAGTTEQLFWNKATDTQYSSTKDYGYLKLMGLDLTDSYPTISHNLNASIYYNANNDALTVSGYTGEVNIYNVLGKLVLKTRVNSNNEIINLNAINRGVYIVSGLNFSSKFIK